MSATQTAYFADENALGFAKLLTRAGRTDIVHPGHPSVPEVPFGCPDLDWIPFVGQHNWIVVSRDRRIRTRPAELSAYWQNGIRSVWLGAKKDLTPQDQVSMFLAHEARLVRLAIKLGEGPWAISLTSSGARPMAIKFPD